MGVQGCVLDPAPARYYCQNPDITSTYIISRSMSEIMMTLKLGPIPDNKPVRMTISLPAELAALLRTYADAVGLRNSNPVTVERIVPHILERFIRTDRALMRTRRQVVDSTPRPAQSAAVEPS